MDGSKNGLSLESMPASLRGLAINLGNLPMAGDLFPCRQARSGTPLLDQRHQRNDDHDAPRSATELTRRNRARAKHDL
jgi:hypothetical protein